MSQFSSNVRELLNVDLSDPLSIASNSTTRELYDGTRVPVDLSWCFFSGTRVPDDLLGSLPKELIIHSKPPLGDFAVSHKLVGGWIISDAFAEIIQSLEPGVHQIFPIQNHVFKCALGCEKRYYLLNILVHLPCIDVQKSTVYWETKEYSTPYPTKLVSLAPKPGVPQSYTAIKNIIKGHHLWRGISNMFPSRTFFSDELFFEIEKRKLIGLQSIHMNEA